MLSKVNMTYLLNTFTEALQLCIAKLPEFNRRTFYTFMKIKTEKLGSQTQDAQLNFLKSEEEIDYVVLSNTY